MNPETIDTIVAISVLIIFTGGGIITNYHMRKSVDEVIDKGIIDLINNLPMPHDRLMREIKKIKDKGSEIKRKFGAYHLLFGIMGITLCGFIYPF